MDHTRHTTLRELFQTCVTDKMEIRLIIQDAGLPLGRLYLDGTPEAVWQEVLEKAAREGEARLKKLVSLVVGRVPRIRAEAAVVAVLGPVYTSPEAVEPTETSTRKASTKGGAGKSPRRTLEGTPTATPDSPPLLTLLHLSDLHFLVDKATARTRFDQSLVSDRLVEDAIRMKDTLKAPDWIVVTGDIAFSGGPAEFERARAWLEKLCRALEVDPSKVLPVPGNHDVNRDLVTSDPWSREDHERLRSTPSRLEDLFTDKGRRRFELALWPKLQAYAKFSARFGGSAITPGQPWWRKQLRHGRAPVYAIGLNSSLLSFDNEDAPGNLALGLGQLEQAFKDLPQEALILALTHHPPEWLVDGPAGKGQGLTAFLQRYPHLYFCGHLHAQGTFISHPIFQGGQLRSVAGAGYDAHAGKHAYAWLQLGAEGIAWWPRVWAAGQQDFIPERNAFKGVDGKGRLLLKTAKLPDALEAWLERCAVREKKPVEQGAGDEASACRPPVEIWRRWLQHTFDQNRWLAMGGIHRPGTEALRIELEQVYVELRAVGTHGAPSARGHGKLDSPEGVREAGGLERSLGLHDVLQMHRRLLLLGDPGSGKTTLLRYIARKVALGWLDPARAAEARALLGLEATETLFVPVCLPLAALNRWLQKAGIHRHELTEGHARAFLKAEFDRIHCCISEQALQHALSSGQVLLLLDGLDEVPGHNDRLLVADAMGALLAAHPKLPAVMTSRTRAFRGGLSSMLSVLECFELQPMSPAVVSRFLRLWFGVVHAPDTRTAEDEAKTLVEEIEAHRELSRMMLNPNILTLIAILKFTRARLPDRRVELYSDIIDLFLDRKDHERDTNEEWEQLGLDLSLSEKRLLVARLALEMHEGGGKGDEIEGGRTIPYRQAQENLAHQLLDGGKRGSWDEALPAAADLLEWLQLRAALLRTREDQGIEFVHLGYQEFLVADALAGRPDEDIWTVVEAHLSEDWWNEPIQLLIAHLQHRAKALLSRLVEAGASNQHVIWSQRGRGIALAMGGLQDIGTLHVSGEVRRHVLGSLTQLTSPETGVPTTDRIEALLALGKVGDPRLGMEKKERWFFVEPGAFMMGDDELTDRSKPTHRVTITQGFHIGRYPVTNQEYGLFVDGGGYKNKKWWKGEGHQWMFNFAQWYEELRSRAPQLEEDPPSWLVPGSEPERWTDPQWNAPNQPVVGVSWFEAEAYCLWLTSWLKDKGVDWLSGALAVRLPTEAEWEFVARGAEGRRFPWGHSEPTADTANFGQKIGRTSPVGAYPKGDSPSGVCDLGGNVWEWCRDWHDGQYYGDSPVEDPVGPESGSNRVLRGGSWFLDASNLRGAYRSWYWPSYRFNYLGFRVVLPASPKPAH